MSYLEYAKGLGGSEELLRWVSTTLTNHINRTSVKNPLTEGLKLMSEVEHVLDYLCSPQRPQKLIRMSYPQAKAKADAWTKTQQKKGKGIKEIQNDVETIKKFKDGSRIVKLIGENAFKREGFLMRHCVASYYGNSKVQIYSYRDKKNEPHATFEVSKDGSEIEQVKGKGNGSIHPNYIKPILVFLKSINFEVRASEMQNLGYYSLNKTMEGLIKDFCGKTAPKIKLGGTAYVFAG